MLMCFSEMSQQTSEQNLNFCFRSDENRENRSTFVKPVELDKLKRPSYLIRQLCTISEYYTKSKTFENDGVLVREVQCMGTVVCKSLAGCFICYSVDDGTGVIRCIVDTNSPTKRTAEELYLIYQDPNCGLEPNDRLALIWKLKRTLDMYETMTSFQLGQCVFVQGVMCKTMWKLAEDSELHKRVVMVFSMCGVENSRLEMEFWRKALENLPMP